MVVCKFFQQGSCRYGQNCRFEHIYGSKYSYNASTHQQSAPAAPTAVTDEQLINQVQADVQSALRGGQWILSSYAPFKEKAAIPGITDLSPEEARLFIYEAKAGNNLDQAVAYMNNLTAQTRQKYEQLLQKNPNIIKLLRSIYNGENVASPFGQTAPNNAASSVFRSAVQTNSVFNQNATSSIFGQNQSNFGTSAADPAKSIFAQASQSVFANNQNIFNTPAQTNPPNPFTQNAQATPQSIFAQASQNAFNQAPNPSSIFGQASQSVFGQAEQPFAQAQAQPAPTNVFQQKPQNVFDMNQNVFHQGSTEEPGIYSKLEDLMKEDLEAFNSEDFKMGFVPEIPPPRSLCF